MPETNPPFHEPERSQLPLTDDLRTREVEQRFPFSPEMRQTPEFVQETHDSIDAILRQEEELLEKLMTPEAYQLYLGYLSQARAIEKEHGDTDQLEIPTDRRGRDVNFLHNKASMIVRSAYRRADDPKDQIMFDIRGDNRPVYDGEKWSMKKEFDYIATSWHLQKGEAGSVRQGKHIRFNVEDRLLEETYPGAYYTNDREKIDKRFLNDHDIKTLNHKLAEIIAAQRQKLDDPQMMELMEDPDIDLGNPDGLN